MKKLIILSFLGLTLLATACQSVDEVQEASTQSNDTDELFVFEETEYDFGVIKQSGGIVEHDFNFTYVGEEPIVVTSTPGSCMCTTAEISQNEFQPGDSGVLTVYFHPNLHAEPEGHFFKSVLIMTDPSISPAPEVKVWQEIDLDLGEEFFELQAPHEDDGHGHDEVSVEPSVPAFVERSSREIVMEAVELVDELDDGMEYQYFTYDGTVPGPFLRAKVGDEVTFTLKNAEDNVNVHSIDLHAVNGPGGGATETQVYPGEEKTFTFEALNPGIYVYHCASPEVADHVANGMYGLILIEPEEGLDPVDREYYVMQGEFYPILLAQLDELSIQLDTEVLYANLTGELAESAAELANHYTSDTFKFVYTSEYATKEFSMKISPDWVSFVEDEAGVLTVEIDQSQLEKYLNESIAPDINQTVQHAKLISLPVEDLDYAEVEGVAKDGVTLMVDETIQNFLAALEEDVHEIELVVKKEQGIIVNETGENLGELTLLATGVSNWEGSPSGRDYNVRKGLNEKVNNILLAPGEEYDFNKNLGPVTNSAGWQNSLAIFRGSELIPVPGGGLCQVSTTVYRAAINAGLEVTERSNHSLYVHYYKAYGDGLDAAIYPGSKNLRFTNDTDNYMLIQAYDDGYDGFVNIYGTPDGRDVELVGPFYPNDIPEEWQDRISLAYNQIGWWQIITDADGNVLEEKQLTGSYRSIPY